MPFKTMDRLRSNTTLACLEEFRSTNYENLTADDEGFGEMHEHLNRFLTTLHIKGDAKKYRLVRKTSFLSLYDEELRKIITSFERIRSPEIAKPNKVEKGQSLKNRRKRKRKNSDRREKKERPSWKYDSNTDLSYIDVSSGSEGWERGHIATYGNHKENEITEKESCYYTNAFLQIKRFHAYRFVEEWARQIFWKFKHVTVVTHLMYENSDQYASNTSKSATNRRTNRPPDCVYKILIWSHASNTSPDETSVMVIFEFPNKKNPHMIGSTNKNSCMQFLKSEEVLKNLPFSVGIEMYSPLRLTTEDMNMVENWKNALSNAVKRYANSPRKERKGYASGKDGKHGFKAIIQPPLENEKTIGDSHYRQSLHRALNPLIFVIYGVIFSYFVLLDIYMITFK